MFSPRALDGLGMLASPVAVGSFRQKKGPRLFVWLQLPIQTRRITQIEGYCDITVNGPLPFANTPFGVFIAKPENTWTAVIANAVQFSVHATVVGGRATSPGTCGVYRENHGREARVGVNSRTFCHRTGG